MTEQGPPVFRRRCCEGGGPKAGRGWGSLLEPALLAVLGSEGSHGYDLRKSVEELTGGACADPGGTYRALRRLEEQGYVVSRWTEGTHGPQRREYDLTDAARCLLCEWRDHLRQRAVALTAVADALDGVLDRTPSDPAAEDPRCVQKA